MIRVEGDAGAERNQTHGKTALVTLQFILLGLNAGFAALLGFRHSNLILLDDGLLLQIRFSLYAAMGGITLVGALLVREHQSKGETDPATAPDVSRSEGGAGLTAASESSGTSPGKEGRKWQNYERLIVCVASILGIFQFIRFDPLAPWFSFGALHQVLAGPFWSPPLDRLTELAILGMVLYLCIKFSMLAASLSGSFNRLYIGRWRVHESVVGILWALVGAAIIIYGLDTFDRTFGIVYLIFGVFFVGRDYLDVQKLRLVEAQNP